MSYNLRKIYDSATGLAINDKTVRVVHLIRYFNRIRLQQFGEEIISSASDPEVATVQAIQQVFARLHLHHKDVIIHIEGPRVRLQEIDLPQTVEMDIPQAVRTRILETSILSNVSQAQQFLIGFHTHYEQDKLRILAAYCHENTLQERVQLVEKTGLYPIMIGAEKLDLALAFALQSDFLSHNILFIDETTVPCSFMVTHHGFPALPPKTQRTLRHVTTEAESTSDKTWTQDDGQNGNSHHSRSTLSAEIAELVFAEHSSDAAIDSCVFVGESSLEKIETPDRFSIVKGQPLQEILQSGQILPPRFSLAAGLAMKKLFPALNTIDLLPAEKRAARQQQCQKIIAQRFILSCGLLVLTGVVLANLLLARCEQKKEQVEREYLVFATTIADLELLQKQRDKAQRALVDMKQLVQEHSVFAPLLQEIAGGLPDGVWLSKLETKMPENDDKQNHVESGNQLHLEGWALNEGNVASFIERLEASASFSQVILLSSSRVTAEEVWKRSKLRRVPLIFFTIEGRTQ